MSLANDDACITLLETQISNANNLTDDEKFSMVDTLQLARLINGDEDLVRRSLKHMLINGVRREMKDPNRIRDTARLVALDIVKQHANSCELKAPTGSLISLSKGRLRISGTAAILISLFVSVIAFMALFTWWQNSRTREIVKLVNQSHAERNGLHE